MWGSSVVQCGLQFPMKFDVSLPKDCDIERLVKPQNMIQIPPFRKFIQNFARKRSMKSTNKTLLSQPFLKNKIYLMLRTLKKTTNNASDCGLLCLKRLIPDQVYSFGLKPFILLSLPILFSTDQLQTSHQISLILSVIIDFNIRLVSVHVCRSTFLI